VIFDLTVDSKEEIEAWGDAINELVGHHIELYGGFSGLNPKFAEADWKTRACEVAGKIRQEFVDAHKRNMEEQSKIWAEENNKRAMFDIQDSREFLSTIVNNWKDGGGDKLLEKLLDCRVHLAAEVDEVVPIACPESIELLKDIHRIASRKIDELFPSVYRSEHGRKKESSQFSPQMLQSRLINAFIDQALIRKIGDDMDLPHYIGQVDLYLFFKKVHAHYAKSREGKSIVECYKTSDDLKKAMVEFRPDLAQDPNDNKGDISAPR
jgi:hypothetical protein